MRKHKYRAWDYEEQEMLEFHNFKEFCNYYQNLGSKDLIMQYTGLLDKNGKEIYEGDIVKSYMCIKPIVVEYKIYQSDSCCVCGEDHINFAGFEFDSIPKSCLEIIGNIYENPELNDYHLEPITIKTKE